MDNLDHFIKYEGEITIIQVNPGESKFAEGNFYIDHNVVFIELKGDNKFSDYTYNTGFYGVVEYPGIQQVFELTLLPNPAMDEFEVISNEQFKLLDGWLKKMNLAKDLKDELEPIKPNENKKQVKKV